MTERQDDILLDEINDTMEQIVDAPLVDRVLLAARLEYLWALLSEVGGKEHEREIS